MPFVLADKLLELEHHEVLEILKKLMREHEEAYQYLEELIDEI